MEGIGDPAPVLQCPRNRPFRSGALMIWASITLDGRTHLHVFERVTVTASSYRDEVLESYACLFRGADDPDFLLKDDNSRVHTHLADEFLESEDIRRMD
ncbi:DDE_3 domain-containing protein [Trichonephila clavipes]|nr:DDE_3 domain-containing protein [Trichonephila clavipes]